MSASACGTKDQSTTSRMPSRRVAARTMRGRSHRVQAPRDRVAVQRQHERREDAQPVSTARGGATPRRNRRAIRRRSRPADLRAAQPGGTPRRGSVVAAIRTSRCCFVGEQLAVSNRRTRRTRCRDPSRSPILPGARRERPVDGVGGLHVLAKHHRRATQAPGDREQRARTAAEGDHGVDWPQLVLGIERPDQRDRPRAGRHTDAGARHRPGGDADDVGAVPLRRRPPCGRAGDGRAAPERDRRDARGARGRRPYPVVRRLDPRLPARGPQASRRAGSTRRRRSRSRARSSPGREGRRASRRRSRGGRRAWPPDAAGRRAASPPRSEGWRAGRPPAARSATRRPRPPATSRPADARGRRRTGEPDPAARTPRGPCGPRGDAACRAARGGGGTSGISPTVRACGRRARRAAAGRRGRRRPAPRRRTARSPRRARG